MKTRSMTRQRAKKLGRTAQLGVAAGAVMLVGASALPVTGWFGPGDGDGGMPVLPPGWEDAAKPDGESEPLDVEMLGGIMMSLGGWVEPVVAVDPPPEVVVAAEPEDEPGTEVPAVGTKVLRYVGSIIGPAGRFALMNIDGRHEYIAEGAERDGVLVREVHGDHVMLDDGGGARRVDKAPSAVSAMMAAPGLARRSGKGPAGPGAVDGAEEIRGSAMDRARQAELEQIRAAAEQRARERAAGNAGKTKGTPPAEKSGIEGNR